MTDVVGIVGSRKGADLEHVRTFVRELHARQPDTLLVSGGADGVDKTAETTWLELGGSLESYRPVRLSEEEYGVEVWYLTAIGNGIHRLPEESWADYKSACFGRDLLIAQRVKRLVVFYRPGKSGGAALTAQFARNGGVEVYEYEAEREENAA